MRDVRVVRLEHAVALLAPDFAAVQQAGQPRHVVWTIQVSERANDM